MNNLLAQIALTLKRLIRNRLIIAVFIVAILILGLLGSAIVAHDIMVETGQGEAARGAASGALVGADFFTGVFSNLIAIIIGATIIRSDIKDGTIFSVLSKPIERWQYLLGSYIGSAVYLLLVWSIFAWLFLGLVFYVEGSLDRAHGLILARQIILSMLLFSLAFFLSQLLNSWIAGALAILVYNGESLVSLFDLIARKLVGPLSLQARAAFGYIFPAVDRLDFLNQLLTGDPVEPLQVGWIFLHLADYSLVMVALALLVFSRKELSQVSD